jgi:hypothetical protein
LFITHAFPPACGSPVYRPLKFVKFLPEYGWKPVVVTPRKNIPPHDLSLCKDIPDGTRVHEVFSLFPENLKALLENKHKRQAIGVVKYIFLRSLLKFFSIFYYRMVLIDWHDGWVPFAFRKATQILKGEGVDLIFVDMEPPSSSIIGLVLKKVTGKSLAIDYHDPWTTSVYAKKKKTLKNWIAEKLEHKVLKSADLVTAGKVLIIEEIQKKYPDLNKRKMFTIFSGFDPDDYKGLVKKRKNKFIITYTGKLSEKYYYSPETFLFAMGELMTEGNIAVDDVSAIFVGTVTEDYQNRFWNIIKENGLENVVVSTGQVDHKLCATYQINTDVLLYIVEAVRDEELSYEFAGAVPSKIYEYIYTGNPILAIVPPGFEADLIRSTRTGYIAEPNNVQSVKRLIFKLFNMYKHGSLQTHPNQEEIQKYSRKTLTGILAEQFDQIYQTTNI